MTRQRIPLAAAWQRVGTRFLPFADAASPTLPLGAAAAPVAVPGRRSAIAAVLLTGTLNRVMIVELGVPAWIVATMVALPLVVAPFRALIGFKSDTHRSFLGWRRVPYIWVGTLLQFGGLAIMPFALLMLSGDTHGPAWIGTVAAALAFLPVGAGLHTTQTAGLALATDLAPPEARPRVVALLYVMLLVGMIASALLFGMLLADFSPAAADPGDPGRGHADLGPQPGRAVEAGAARPVPHHRRATARRRFASAGRSSTAAAADRRFLVAVGLGTAGFAMQDVLLEPYGGEILGLAVAATTTLTAFSGGRHAGGVRAGGARGSAAARIRYRLAAFGRAGRDRRVLGGDLRGRRSIRRCCSAPARC